MLIFLLSLADEQFRPQIERLFRRYHNKMLRVARQSFARAKHHNPALDAEDAVQSTFLSIVRYANSVPFGKPENELKAYLFTILHHEITKIIEEPELPSQDGVEDIIDIESLSDLAERIDIRDQYAEVVTAIRDMDPKYSSVLLLCYGEEMTVKQAAEVLGISPNTVYTRLRRGKQQLIEKFAKEGE